VRADSHGTMPIALDVDRLGSGPGQLLPPNMSAAGSRHFAELRSIGFTVIDAVIPAAEVAAVRDCVFRTAQEHSAMMLAAASPEAKDTRDRGILHLPAMLNHDQSLAPYLARPAVFEVVQAHLGMGARITFTTSQTNLPGCKRGNWHADYPYNQSNMQRVEAPYMPGPGHSFGITTLWMLSEFRPGCGTLVVPYSHMQPINPTMPACSLHPHQFEPHPEEISVTGKAGSVLLMDSRVWHAIPPWPSASEYPNPEPRVGVAVRFSPWWMDVETLVPNSHERQRLLEETRKVDPAVNAGNTQPAMPREVWERLPDELRPLLWHRVADRPRF
jgi:ectoine hydroxylase-related dioxygenase (phytanoyl-CoA dioxygenase family)